MSEFALQQTPSFIADFPIVVWINARFDWTNSLGVASDGRTRRLRSQSRGSIEDIEGKPLKNEPACAVIGQWVGVGGVFDSRYGVLDSLREY